MGNERKIPMRLYKYRDFDSRTLDMVVNDYVYYADPNTFNDPLDTQPSLKTDLGESELERIVRRFFERRISAEMSAVAQTIRIRGPKTTEFIKRQSRLQVDQLIQEIQYHATDPDYESENQLCMLLGHSIEVELLRQYDKGIVSLAEQATCPLMWSHYGGQHRGVCIAYSVSAKSAVSLYKVQYGGSRLVEASKVAAMLNGNDVACDQVDEAVLLRKAESWRYEREWRLIGPRGLQSSPLELEEIIFGIRCGESVKYAVMKALEGRKPPVRFYEIREGIGTFKLKKSAFHSGEESFVHLPRRSIRMGEYFGTLFTSTSPNQME